MVEPWLIAPISALVSILAGLYFYYYVNKQDSGTDRMKEIAAAIKTGANAFLKREYTVLTMFVIVVAVLIMVFLPAPIWSTSDPLKNVGLGTAYMFGSFCSALAGLLGMNVATKANVRTANAAKQGLNKAFPIGFRGGAVMGLAVVGIGLLGISTVFAITGIPSARRNRPRSRRCRARGFRAWGCDQYTTFGWRFPRARARP